MTRIVCDRPPTCTRYDVAHDAGEGVTVYHLATVDGLAHRLERARELLREWSRWDATVRVRIAANRWRDLPAVECVILEHHEARA